MPPKRFSFNETSEERRLRLQNLRNRVRAIGQPGRTPTLITRPDGTAIVARNAEEVETANQEVENELLNAAEPGSVAMALSARPRPVTPRTIVGYSPAAVEVANMERREQRAFNANRVIQTAEGNVDIHMEGSFLNESTALAHQQEAIQKIRSLQFSKSRNNIEEQVASFGLYSASNRIAYRGEDAVKTATTILQLDSFKKLQSNAKGGLNRTYLDNVRDLQREFVLKRKEQVLQEAERSSAA